MPRRCPKTSHFLEYLKGSLNQLDKFPELNGVYLVINNALIYNHKDINNLIASRGYTCIYLLPHSPELNPIDNLKELIVVNLMIRRIFIQE